LNEHWLGTEAQIREEFDIPGPRPDFIEKVRRKSLMKEVFAKAGVATIQGTVVTDLAGALDFTAKHHYPFIVKPDTGAGASGTYRVDNENELRKVFADRQSDTSPVVVEEFVDGRVFTFDGIVDANGEITFAATTRYDQSIMDVVNTGDNAYYLTLPEVPWNVLEAGTAIVRAYGLRERFFHIEIFDRWDGSGLVGLEINLRPPGAWMTDAMNVAHSTDVYRRWAAMVAGAPLPAAGPDHYYAAYASRKNFIKYAHNHQENLAFLGDRLIKHRAIESVLQAAMGDEAYLARATTNEEAGEIIAYIQKRA
jgi:biotin carboxylase